MFNWQRLGQIFHVSGQQPWLASHAQNPNCLELEDRWRIFFTSRPTADADGSQSVISWVDIDPKPPFTIIGQAEKPCLSPGVLGAFDQYGVMPGSLIRHPKSGQIYLYYVGWRRLHGVPYDWNIGLAMSDDNGQHFYRPFAGPLLTATAHEPFLFACPRVTQQNDRWHMHYPGGVAWHAQQPKPESQYLIRYAYSSDGIHWQRNPRPIITPKVPEECQTSPSYLFYNQRHWLFYSYRHGLNFRNKNRGYRIGLAQSLDGQNWTRIDDQAGLNPSPHGWDSDMTCYPHIFQSQGALWCLYNGNNFGHDGFGLARLQDVS